MASPKRIRDKVYRIVYDVPSQDGTRKQKTETLNDVTKREAEAILAKRIEIAKKGEYVTDPNITMSELFDKFMSAKKRRLEATTIDRYTSLLSTYLRPELGAIKIASLRKAHLVEAYDKWQSRERKPSGRTIKHAHDLVRATLNWAVSLDYLSTNVATKIKSEDLPKAPKPENTVLDESELRRLLAEAKTPTKRAKSRKTLSSQPWFYPAVAFAAHTGARRGEVLGLRWTDLDLDGGRATIRQSLAQPRSGLVFKEPKNGKARSISLSANLVSILRSHRAARRRRSCSLERRTATKV
jgi:integrase